MSVRIPVCLAVVGMGSRARHLTRLFSAHPRCKGVAIVDQIPAVVEYAAKKIGGADFASFDRLLREATNDAPVTVDVRRAVESAAPRSWRLGPPNREARPSMCRVPARPGVAKQTMEGIGPYGQMITTFSDCILRGTEPPITLEDGRHSVRVVDAIYRAVRERRVVRVDEVAAGGCSRANERQETARPFGRDALPAEKDTEARAGR